MLKLVLILLIGICYVLSMPSKQIPARPAAAQTQNTVDESADTAHRIAHAFEAHQSNLQVEGTGEVSKILKDDREGLQHQRFILRLPDGRSLLVAHNLDLAPRIENLQIGDTVRFYGEYEWNPKGGVLHWTHHDPHHHHPDGWLEHHGKRYQ